MDKSDAPGNGRGEANAIVSSKNVIVHGFGYGNNREFFLLQSVCKAEGIVTPYGNDGINLQVFEII
ncbi:MAG: hypothetical protein QGG48_14235 [Desulfatiglandales bacterium]|nr:hypothetical protein [Desulfatiglandales bacterium]